MMLLLRCMTAILCIVFMPLTLKAGLFNHEFFQLSNGMKVYVLKNKLAPIVHTRLYINVGTADDPSDQRGLSHFLEHMLFKGTKRIPKGWFDKLLLQYGAAYNAHTTDDYTCYETTIGKDYLELVLFLEADRMQNIDFTADDVEAERQVVLEERAMRVDNQPFGKADEIFLKTLYWKHPYGTPPIGYEEHINAYTLDSVKAHHARFYTPNNMVLIISGDVTLAQVKPLVVKYFGGMKAHPLPPRLRVQEPTHVGTSTRVHHDTERTPTVHIQYAYTAPNYFSEMRRHALPLVILRHILAGNTISRFYTRFVVDEPLASLVDIDYEDVSVDPKYFQVTFNLLENTDPRYFRQRYYQEIQKLVQNGITTQELDQAKSDLLSYIAYMKDGAENIAYSFSNIIFDVPLDTLEDWDKDVQSVTLNDVNEAMRYVLRHRPAVVMIVSPTSKTAGQKSSIEPMHKNFSLWEKMQHTLSNIFTDGDAEKDTAKTPEGEE